MVDGDAPRIISYETGPCFGACPIYRVTLNEDGSGQTNLTPKDPTVIDADWNSRAPSWSNTGHQIYFTGFRPSTGLDTEIFVMNDDGSGQTNITNSLGTDADAHVR